MTGAAPTVQVTTAPDCNCADGPRVPVLVPEHYQEDRWAVAAYVRWRERERSAGRYLYWAVHLRGGHVLNVLARAAVPEEEGGPRG